MSQAFNSTVAIFLLLLSISFINTHLQHEEDQRTDYEIMRNHLNVLETAIPDM